MAAENRPDNPAPMKEPGHEKVEIDIAGPLVFWVIILVMGLLIEIVGVPIVKQTNLPIVGSLMPSLASWILTMPGSIVLPLIVSLWIGERVGASRNKANVALKIGAINGFYTAFVYAIVIFIVYMLVNYIDPQFLPVLLYSSPSAPNGAVPSFVLYDVAIPIAIVIVLVPFISMLSAARHSTG